MSQPIGDSGASIVNNDNSKWVSDAPCPPEWEEIESYTTEYTSEYK